MSVVRSHLKCLDVRPDSSLRKSPALLEFHLLRAGARGAFQGGSEHVCFDPAAFVAD